MTPSSVVFAGGALVALSTGYLLLSLLLSRRPAKLRGDGPPVDRVVVVVPALDEEAVIGATLDSLARLAAQATVPVTVVVVDDGSTDGTGDLVAAHPLADVVCLRRDAPDARQGKGAALNHAYRRIREGAAGAGLDPATTVLAILDADGRLPPEALEPVLRRFADARVGAVQVQVRIRNRQSLIGRFQDYEFLLFASITQTAREHLGSVGLGGNGQVTRLSALADLGDEPWSDCLTEDLDLGVRLALAGWRNRFCPEVAVDQQGVETVPALLRQRTRWMQGHFQCWRLIPPIYTSSLPTATALDLVYYLVAPSLALIGSIAFPLPIALLLLAVLRDTSTHLGTVDGLAYLGLLYALSFGPMLALAVLYRRRAGDIGLLATLAFAHLLPLYSWVWYIAEWRALGRIVRRRSGWAKTARATEGPVVAPT